jgi:predicted Zn-dependent peptidase
VRTGARDETPEVSGVTHFLEHMVFKGTPHRTTFDLNRDFDDIGAHYNAFTSEENTVFYAAILPEYLPQAVDILADILRPSLLTEDFDMEKNVIIEEIGMYEDQPMWSAYDAAKRLYFYDHPLGNTILGTADGIRALSRDVRREGITDEELRQAKNKTGSRVVRGSERPMGRMQAIGMAWTYLHKYRTVDEDLQAFDAVEVKTIRELLERYPLDQTTTLALGPLSKLHAPQTNGKR